MRLYISGKMTGEPENNFPLFNRWAKFLRAAGFEVVNPAELFSGEDPASREKDMRLDIEALLLVDKVEVLPRWEESPGSRLEVAIALELGIPVVDIETGMPIRRRVETVVS